MKPYIDGIIVVEGTNDAALITSLIDAEVVTLNGCELKNIKYLKLASKNNQIYLLTDPDQEGKRIRQKVLNEIPSCINIEIDINKCTKDIKNGVAECENNEVLHVISKYCTNKPQEIKNDKNIIFTSLEREKICLKLGIENVNNKQLNKRLKRLKINEEQIQRMLEE